MSYRDEVAAAIKEIFTVNANAETKEVEALQEDMNWREAIPSMDSLDHVEVFMTIEDRYDIELSDDECFKAVTFGDMLDLVCRKVC